MQSYYLSQWIIFFFLYSFVGWIWESCYVSAKKRRWVNRGFMHGPMLPLYGSGAVVILIATIPVRGNIVFVFLLGMTAATVLEYFTGAAMERLFHVRYWDYSHVRFNLNGHICPAASLCWGCFSVLMTEVVHPPVERLYESMPPWLVNTLCTTLLVILLVDAALTIRRLALVSQLVVKLAAARDAAQVQFSLGRAELEQRLESQSAAMRSKYNQQIARLEELSRSFRRKYADMHLTSRYASLTEDLKATAAAARSELLKKRAERKQKPKKS